MAMVGGGLVFLGGVIMKFAGGAGNRLWRIGQVVALAGAFLLFMTILRFYLPTLRKRFFPRHDSTEDETKDDEDDNDENDQ